MALQWRIRILAFCSGALLLGATLGILEFSLRALGYYKPIPYVKNRKDYSEQEYRIYLRVRAERAQKFSELLREKSDFESSDFFEPGDSYGSRLRANYHTIAARKVQGRILFQADYQTDAWGRRIVVPSVGAKKFTLFFGGSRVFGQGVNNSENLPSQYQALAPESTVYNYGIPGHGPLTLLTLLKSGKLREQVTQKNGDILLFIEEDLFWRLIPSTFNPHSYAFPFYHKGENGRLEYVATYWDYQPWRTSLYFYLAKSALFQFAKIHFPLFISDQVQRYAVDVLREIDYEIRRQFPGARFYVVSLTGYSFLQELKKNNIPQMDCNAFAAIQELKLQGISTEIPVDGHPTPAVYRMEAEALHRALVAAAANPSTSLVCDFQSPQRLGMESFGSEE